MIGAGPAGLAAAYDLARLGRTPLVLEKDRQVGGLARTIDRGGFRFDIGGHRFFTKSAEVEALWREVLPRDLLLRRRLSRIYYRGRFFNYPLRPLNALLGLGPLASLRVIGSFLLRKLFPVRPVASFEDWVSNRFGGALYSMFFRRYAEKVWGVPCAGLSADGAAQRIRNLSLGRALLRAIGIGRRRGVASLIEEFDYPRHGPGQMYDRMAELAREAGAHFALESEAVGVLHSGGRVRAVRVRGPEGEREIEAENVVSTMPITELVKALDPAPPAEVLDAARSLRYRSIITVNLVVRAEHVLPDTWVYIHAPEVTASRLQLYKNWSPEMVPDPSMSTLGVEYFAFEGDDLWGSRDGDLVERAREDLAKLGVTSAPLTDAFVVRYAKAYPLYEIGYREHLMTIRRHLARFPNLACAGRYGQFRYNNMDHSIMTGRLAVRRLLGEDVDPWAVNEEAEYLEE